MLLERIRAVTGGEVVFLPRSGGLEEQIAAMQQAETIVISGPCYVNTYPAALMALLEAASLAGGFSGRKLYGIINGGMPYVHTHRHGLTCLHLFAEQNHLLWQGGFVLGGGAMLDGKPLEKHMRRRRVVPAFDRFIRHIAEGTLSPDRLYEQAQVQPGKIITRIFARLLTRGVVKRLKRYGHDPEAPDWYLREQGKEFGSRS
jgi:hypothetical protein